MIHFFDVSATKSINAKTWIKIHTIHKTQKKKKVKVRIKLMSNVYADAFFGEDIFFFNVQRIHSSISKSHFTSLYKNFS